MRRFRPVAVLMIAVLLAAAGCGSGGGATPTTPSGAATTAGADSGGPGPTGSPAPTGIPSTAGASTEPSNAPSGPGGGAAARCALRQLRVTIGQADAGAGHWGLPLVFTNSGGTACELKGYPGVAGLNAAGRQVTQARREASGYLGGLAGNATPPLVRLAPGASAAALLEGSNVPRGTATDCPQYAGLLVTPPDETHSVRLDTGARGCDGLHIHPVVPGTDGTGQR
ncbi:DUF4232 domain-containing protein [Plantactinospora siamensis]|uniref:DUF4232 domain-containing protein n=1 Tax=Plantactinospora siamensis TaxID=555372 RepID=A0ABV6P4I4_9ACTN